MQVLPNGLPSHPPPISFKCKDVHKLRLGNKEAVIKISIVCYHTAKRLCRNDDHEVVVGVVRKINLVEASFLLLLATFDHLDATEASMFALLLE